MQLDKRLPVTVTHCNRVPTKVLQKNSLTFQTGFQKFQLVLWYEIYGDPAKFATGFRR